MTAANPTNEENPQSTAHAASSDHPKHQWSLPVWALVVLANLACLLVGFLPLVIGDSNAREIPVGIDRLAGPWAWPLLDSSLAHTALSGLIGGVLAGLLGLAAREGPRWHRQVATFAGVAGVALVFALSLQSLWSLPGISRGDGLALTGYVLVAITATVAGWAVGSAAVFGRAGLGIALSVLAGAVPGWLVAFWSDGPGMLTAAAVPGIWAVTPLLLTPAIVAFGFRPRTRLAWWPVGVLATWLVYPATQAIGLFESLLWVRYRMRTSIADVFAESLLVLTGSAAPHARGMLVVWILVALLLGGLLAARRRE